MKKQQFIFTSCVLSLLFLALPVAAQKGFNGSWAWTSRPDKEKMQTYFYADIKQRGNKVTGNLGSSTLVNGEVEDEASKTPFIGTIKGNVLTIEFDPEDINSLYEENLRYKRPKNKVPSTATLQLKNGKLEWSQLRGGFDSGMPKKFTLNRGK